MVHFTSLIAFNCLASDVKGSKIIQNIVSELDSGCCQIHRTSQLALFEILRMLIFDGVDMGTFRF